MSPVEIFLVVILLLGLPGFAIALARQGHPGDSMRGDLPTDLGPTGEPYPSRSRPAGPGAESMIEEPSPRQRSVSDDGLAAGS